jgi:hypothetical protein
MIGPMKLLTFALLLVSVSLAADPPKPAPAPEKFPISAEDMTLFNGLIQNIQAVQKQVQQAEEKLRNTVCAEKHISVVDCNVDWQAGTVSKKVAVASAAPVPEKKP